jgi:hypothetical protein
LLVSDYPRRDQSSRPRGRRLSLTASTSPDILTPPAAGRPSRAPKARWPRCVATPLPASAIAPSAARRTRTRRLVCVWRTAVQSERPIAGTMSTR